MNLVIMSKFKKQKKSNKDILLFFAKNEANAQIYANNLNFWSTDLCMV